VSGYTAIVAGATGLVGGECLARLLKEPRYRRVVVVARRKPDEAIRSRKLEHVIVDFEELGDVAAALRGDHAFCALGTTIRKAGSQTAFRRVDHDFVLRFAELARAGGAAHFSCVSALGASRTSPFFYSRVKGEVEAALRALDWPSLAIFRPSVISGDRGESRPLERLGEHMLRLAPGRWRPVAAADIAAAMVATALESPPGVTVVESADIGRVATAATRRS